MSRIVRDYIAELRRSPVKTGAIGVLLACGLLLWGRLLLQEVPRTASAWDPLDTRADASAPSRAATPARDANALHLEVPGPLDRDLFALDPNPYRRTTAQQEEANQAKPGPEGTEETKQAAVRSAARQLRMTSIIEGEQPVVMINNRPLRRGDTIEGFTVVAFQGRTVILEKLGVKVRLSL